MANTLISKTFSSAGNRKTWTWSAWLKIAANTSNNYTLMTQVDGWAGNGNGGFYLNGESLEAYNLLSNVNSGTSSRVSTNANLRDPNAWYHIVLRFDTTQSTASDRVRWYINGQLQTSMKYANYPSQNFDANFNTAAAHGIGRHTNSNTYPYDGSMSHIHFCDGYSYAPTEFGQTDSITGEWKIKTSPSVSYGTNGFFILKDSNSVTDQSGQGNDWTVSVGTLTKTEDNPSNNFSTLNYLNMPTSNLPTFANGNTTATSSSSASGKFGGSSSLGMTSGKFYVEAQAEIPGTYSRSVFGLSGAVSLIARNNNTFLSDTDNSIGWYSEDGTVNYNNSSQYTASSYTANDVLMMAVDMDNLKVYLGKNGVWQNSGVPTSGSTGTGAISIAAVSSCHDGAYFFGFSDDTGTDSTAQCKYNVGNGYFGTDAVTTNSGNGYQDADGNGIFKYTVPTNYRALCTKGLNQ
jgi:hypothetical protein